MAVLVLLSIILVRNLKVENPGKKQLVLETIITTFNNLFKGVIGEAGMKYVPYLITVFCTSAWPTSWVYLALNHRQRI